MKKEAVQVPALRHKRRFFKELGVCPESGYNLIAEYPPKIVRVGSRDFIAETATEYRDRVAALQATAKVAA